MRKSWSLLPASSRGSPIHILRTEPGDPAEIEAIENEADALLIDLLDPSRDRRGIGRKLIATSAAEAHNRGFDGLIGRTDAELAWNAPF